MYKTGRACVHLLYINWYVLMTCPHGIFALNSSLSSREIMSGAVVTVIVSNWPSQRFRLYAVSDGVIWCSKQMLLYTMLSSSNTVLVSTRVSKDQNSGDVTFCTGKPVDVATLVLRLTRRVLLQLSWSRSFANMISNYGFVCFWWWKIIKIVHS